MIFLPFAQEDENNARRKTVLLHFIIVWAASEHNIIIRRKKIKFGAIKSTVHDLIKFTIGKGVVNIGAIKKLLNVIKLWLPKKSQEVQSDEGMKNQR